MRPDGKPTAEVTEEPTKSPVILLLGAFGDTTWRMFVPTVGFMTAGFYADKEFSSFPWLFIAGLVIGSIIAGYLIKQQLSKKV